jgi:hypothetical protein
MGQLAGECFVIVQRGGGDVESGKVGHRTLTLSQWDAWGRGLVGQLRGYLTFNVIN